MSPRHSRRSDKSPITQPGQFNVVWDRSFPLRTPVLPEHHLRIGARGKELLIASQRLGTSSLHRQSYRGRGLLVLPPPRWLFYFWKPLSPVPRPPSPKLFFNHTSPTLQCPPPGIPTMPPWAQRRPQRRPQLQLRLLGRVHLPRPRPTRAMQTRHPRRMPSLGCSPPRTGCSSRR